MVDIPFPTSTNPGSAPGEGAGRIINCYAYKDAGAPRWKPSPGLDSFASIAVGEVRGWLYYLGLVIAVVGNQVIQIDGGAGVTTLEDTLAGDGPVTIARNNNVPPDIVVTSNSGSFVLADGVVKSYPTPDQVPNLPSTNSYTALPNINSIAFLDGYLLGTTRDGKIYASDLNSLGVQTLSFASAEARPDGLLRGVVYGQQYFAMGDETIEVWQDAGTQPFPLTRSTVIPIGLIGQWAVSGYEDGWAGPLIFVAQDGSVRLLDGYTPLRISNDDLEALIAVVSDPTTLRAEIYTAGGNQFWVLSSPTWTWEYNVTTGLWNERQSYQRARWRGALTVKAFGTWLIADEAGGEIYTLNTDTRAEGSDPLVWGMDAGPVKDFPHRIAVPAAYFDFVLGQAASGASASVMLSWSHDGGATWANPITRSLGAQGQSVGRISVNRVGLTSHHGIRWRFRIADPAYSSFASARMDAAERR